MRDGEPRGRDGRAGCSALPSCEVLEVARRRRRPELLVPLVSDAVRAVDVERRGSTSTCASSGEAVMEIDVFTLFPEAFDWFAGQRHVANALAARPRARATSTTATTRR